MSRLSASAPRAGHGTELGPGYTAGKYEVFWNTPYGCPAPVHTYRCAANQCTPAPAGSSGLALSECLSACGPEKLDRFRCVNDTCVASLVGAATNSSCAKTCGPIPVARCAAALTKACEAARRSGSYRPRDSDPQDC